MRYVSASLLPRYVHSRMPEQSRYLLEQRTYLRTEFIQKRKRLDSNCKVQPYWAYHDAYQYLERSLKFKIFWCDDG